MSQQHLILSSGLHVTTASHIKVEVDNLANRFPNTTPVLLEVDRRPDEVEKLIKSHDLVIRLVINLSVLLIFMD